jgi:hypothetical protein
MCEGWICYTIDHVRAQYKRYADCQQENVEFTVGDKVWLEVTNLSTDAPSKKLSPRRSGQVEGP